MKLVIEVELGNDALETSSEAALSIQTALLAQTPFESLEVGMCGTIRDGNGNTVGRWDVVA